MKSVRVFLLGVTMIAAGVLLLAACKSPPPPLYPPASAAVGPEYGLFWFGKENANQLALPGEANPYYDPARPTLIFVHGWKPDQGYTHRTMIWEFEDASGQEQSVDLAAAWVDAGWNIGVFDWGPFADESIVTDAEAKIWTTNGNEGMRWRDREGEYRTDHTVDRPISDLFYGTLVHALADFHGPELRIAGHSLGNQVAVGAVGKVATDVRAGKLPSELLPSQLVLLDPYWSPVGQDYLGKQSTGDAVRRFIAEDVGPQEIVISWYRSSLMTEGILVSDANEALRRFVATYSELDPAYCSVADQVCRHDAAWQSYLYSFAFSPPKECARTTPDAECLPTGRMAASASTPVETLAEMTGQPFDWVQVAGPDDESLLTRRTDDDWYERKLAETPQ